MSYHRATSPGSRRIQNPGRASDTFIDPYYGQARHNSYASPRTSSGVIPLSSETYITEQPGSAREPPRGGIYSGQYGTSTSTGRPRRSSLVDSQRASAPVVTQLPSRSRPTVVQDSGRPSSPLKGTREKDYYVTPAVSKEPRKMEHKKIYSVNTDGDAKLVADIDAPAGRERHHRRRESVERGGYLTSGNDRDRGRRDYYPSGRSMARDASVDDKDVYSYTDAATMYATTEPKWRPEGPRARRGSVDRGASRDRPVSMVDTSYDPRTSAKDVGPPPSTRGWEAINRVGRTTSVRDGPQRTVAQSPVRSRFAEPVAAPYLDPREPYIVPPRTSSREGRSQALHNDRPVERYAEHDRERDTRRERRESVTRRPNDSQLRRADPSVPTRGFGIRSESQDRYARDERGSDESMKDRQAYRDSGLGYAEPHQRDTGPEISYHEERRIEQERKDREIARLQAEERDRQYERERERDRKRDDERAYDRDYDRDYDRERKERDRAAERETERERERQRMMEREPERERDRPRVAEREPEREKDRERHHHRRETDRDRDQDRERDRDRDRGSRKENGENGPSLAQAATGGLAAGAAAFGLNKVFNKDKGDDRERDRDRDRDSDRERKKERERDRDHERDVDRKRQEEPLRKDDRERRDRRPEGSHSDGSGAPFDREPREERYRDADRGLGFAFERQPELPKPAPPVTERPREREREAPRAQDWQADRDIEREHEDKHVEMPHPPNDADEDYRRRMEQVQRELGRAPPVEERGSTESTDPDRERRRREREQRQREKDEREFAEPKLNAGIGLTGINEQPPPPALRRSFEDTPSEVTASSVSGQPNQALRRKRSILDEPMTNEPVQIIDNSYSDKRENRVRIVDPPTEEEERKPKGILKRPTQKFPDHPNTIREGVAPLKDATGKGIPPGARWTKIDRRLVNPEALEEAKERFEERLDCVIVLRVLTKEEIQKLADRTSALRDERYETDRLDRKAAKRRDRAAARRDNDEYVDDNSEDEYAERPVRMLEAPAAAAPSLNLPGGTVAGSIAGLSGVNGAGEADFIRDRERRRDGGRDGARDGAREGEAVYQMSGGLGRRE
ncbi:hypothetical protein LTR35_008824 [Friedmanniomyces endolithicus]|nr:hypothetical protein LTR35_008824 [Friedmanniomyces endolithicus]KAK0294993.1 hypothetical protein LTS00_006459 [Friedmanniomyces endolithicus]